MKKILFLIFFPLFIYGQAGGIKIDRTTNPPIWTIPGGFSYTLTHTFLKTTSDYTPDTEVQTFLKMTPSFTTVHTTNMTVVGDTVTIDAGQSGCYYMVLNFTIQGSNGDDYTIAAAKNGVITDSVRQTTIGATNYQGVALQATFANAVAGDDISFYVKNLSNSNNPTFREISVSIKMEHR